MTLIPMPPRTPPSIDGKVDDAANLQPGEDHVAAVFIRNSGRVSGLRQHGDAGAIEVAIRPAAGGR